MQKAKKKPSTPPKAPSDKFEILKLTEINPSSFNMRDDFSGDDFDSLVDSIQDNGVLQPILVRPVKGKKPYEIVFGERRYRAAVVASKRKGGRKTIPVSIRELTDVEAYSLMIVENLHREGVTPLEEARGFKDYLDKNGEAAVQDLAERCKIKPTYIRRRVAVLNLPEPALEAWNDGNLAYGYLEQLNRLDDENEVLELLESILEGDDFFTVPELKDHLDTQAVEFSVAKFKLKASGCTSCSSNSDVQIKMFDIDAEKTKCLNTGCFKEHQIKWLDANWKKSSFRKKYKTSGYKFNDYLRNSEWNPFYDSDKVGEKCLTCDAFVTVFYDFRLDVNYEMVCVGEKSCFSKVTKPAEASKKAASGNDGAGATINDDTPRVEWHGEYFREQFFKQALPKKFETVESGKLQALQVVLFTLIKSGWEIREWFTCEYLKLKDRMVMDQAALFAPISEMNLQAVNDAIKAVTLQLVLYDDFSADARRVVGAHIGIDLSKEWGITEEYLQKKRISEILGIGECHGVFTDPKAQSYLSDVIGKNRYDKCKKTELIDIFLKSGADLRGKVPDEILRR